MLEESDIKYHHSVIYIKYSHIFNQSNAEFFLKEMRNGENKPYSLNLKCFTLIKITHFKPQIKKMILVKLNA